VQESLIKALTADRHPETDEETCRAALPVPEHSRGD
jgi:hypothetical protein